MGASHFCNLDGLEAHPTGEISGTGILPVQIWDAPRYDIVLVTRDQKILDDPHGKTL